MDSKKDLLPCEFCKKTIVSENLYVHQSECLPSSVTFKNLPLQEDVGLSNKSNEFINDITKDFFPCEFCDVPITSNNLMCHQIMCRKSYIKTKHNNSDSKIAKYKSSAKISKLNLNSENISRSNYILSNVNETLSFADTFFNELSNTLKRNNSTNRYSVDWNSSSNKFIALSDASIIAPTFSEPNSSSISNNYVVFPTKVTDHQLYQSSSSVNASKFLTLKHNCNAHLPIASNTNLKSTIYHYSVDSMFNFQSYDKYSTHNNVSFSEHDSFVFIYLIQTFKFVYYERFINVIFIHKMMLGVIFLRRYMTNFKISKNF